MDRLRFFRIAIWVPLALLSLMLLGGWAIEDRQDMPFEQLFLIYGLGFGTLAYPLFALWACHHILHKNEQEIIRRIWLAPLIFIPFYGMPWIVYGLANLAIGNTSGIGMLFLWLSFLPYILAVGYFISTLTFFINKLLTVLAKSRKEKPHPHFSPVPDNPDIAKGNERLNPYPAKTFLGGQNLYAYYLIVMLKHDDFPELQALIATRFGNQELKSGTTLCNENQESLAVAYHEEFGGIVVEATTNSTPLIREIDSHFPAPPPPWIAFPKMEPIEAQMSMQGSLEYWWSHIWLPFWSTRSPFEKEQYLLDNGATAEWSEALP